MAVHFDGTGSSYFETINNIRSWSGAGARSLGFWVNVQADNYIIGTENAYVYSQFYVSASSGGQEHLRYFDSSHASQNLYATRPSGYCLYIVTLDAGGISTYTCAENAAPVAGDTDSNPPNSIGGYQLLVGMAGYKGNTTDQFTGDLCQLFIINQALTAAQIQSLAAGATIDSIGTPVSWWKLADVADTTDYGSAGNDLSVIGSPTTAAGPSVLQATPSPVSLIGAAASVATGTGMLRIALPLTASASATATAAGTVKLTIPLAGTASADVSASAALGAHSHNALAGAAQSSVGGDATITLDNALTASAQAAADGNADITLNIALAGAALAAATASGALTSAGELGAHASASVRAQGDLVQSIPVRSAALVATNATGTLAHRIALTSAAAVISCAQGALHVSATLGGAALAAAAVHGDLALHIALDAHAAARIRASLALTLASEGTRPSPKWRAAFAPRLMHAARATRRLTARLA